MNEAKWTPVWRIERGNSGADHPLFIVADGKAGLRLWTDDDTRLAGTAPELYQALKKAVYELNTIRARDGVPWTGVPFPMNTDVTEDYFSSVVDECFAALAKARGEA